MTVAIPPLTEQPRLVFFHSSLSGHCRRVEGFLAQVLQFLYQKQMKVAA